MNPKEKAKDIYDKMKGFRVTNNHRKKCALIAVNEIIESMYEYHTLYEWWQEVKQEIEKL